jgi:hypothetical protein
MTRNYPLLAATAVNCKAGRNRLRRTGFGYLIIPVDRRIVACIRNVSAEGWCGGENGVVLDLHALLAAARQLAQEIVATTTGVQG